MENQFIEGLDALFAVNETGQAGEYLTEWYHRAAMENDRRLMVTVLNEMMGYYRSMGNEPQALEAVEKMVRLMDAYPLSDSQETGTVWINVGTTLCRFYQYKEGLKYYKMATEALRDCDNEYVLASLYNNSAAAYEADGDTEKSMACYEKSLELLKKYPECITFAAITYANMADSYFRNGHEEKGEQCLAAMDAILDQDGIPRDAGYASACVKCAALHNNIGNTERAGELDRRAEAIYRDGRR